MNTVHDFGGVDEAASWAAWAWTDLAARPGRDRTVVVLPLCGIADWALGDSLDVEERLALHVLRAALQPAPTATASDLDVLATPPLRFVTGPKHASIFAVDFELSQALIREVVESIASAGFRRVVLYNSSPWNEDVCDAAARDLRIERAVQMFCINLGGLGLDLRARGPGEIERLRRAAAAAGPVRSAASNTPAAGGAGDGPAILSAAARRLRELLIEVQEREPLRPPPG